MRLSFDHLYPLWLILLVLPLIILPFIKYAKKTTRQKVFLTLRTLTALLIILSMCGVSLVKTAKDTTTIFISDLSDSTLDRQKLIENFISDALKSKDSNDITGIIGFGADSSTENEPSKQTIFNGFQTSVDTDFTNISGALLHGAALFPPNTKKRMVLITDGLENMGDSERQIRALQQNGTIVDVYGVVKGDFEEVQLSQVLVPEKAGKNQVIDIAAHIESNVKTKATILLYAGNALKHEQQVDLDLGTNKFIFTDTVSSGGVLSYRVEIIPEKDTYMENNYLSSFVTVNDLPVILLIEDEDGQGEQIIKMLEEHVTIEVKAPEEAPQTLESLIKYDGFILADISIERFNAKFLTNLENVVKNQGKGLLVTGGDSSYGPGGYYKTILEEMLPVNIDVKPKEEKPNLALLLVIDKSGSMTEGQYGISRLELAKEAAIRSTEVLEPKDMLGVIAFDDSIKWVVDLQLATDKGALQDQIATIVPGGGTSIRPSLEAAVNALIDTDTKLKHIILLTDGQAETTGYETAINNMRDHSITLSTVAVGKGSDKLLLQVLANAGGGRYYLTDEFSDIPSIFTKEAFMAGKKYLNNVTFSPTLINWSQIMKGIDAVPELDGYVATTIKPTSKLLLAGPEDDPILATGQYGLGRTIAWTSDANGLWTAKWLTWDQSPSFWTNLISWMVQQDMDKKYTATTSYEGGEGVITVKSLGEEAVSAAEISGILVTPEGTETEVILEATAPGTYTGSFEASGEGVYMINMLLESEGVTEKIVTGLNVGYSPEYNFYSKRGITPERIAELSGGRVLKNAKEVFKGEVLPVVGSNNISNILLLLGLILFMSEIAIRKTNVSFSFIDRFMKAFTSKGREIKADITEYMATKTVQTKEVVQGQSIQERKKPSKEKTAPVNSKGKEKKQEKAQTVDRSHIDVLLDKKRKRGQ
ncbi:MAG: von willebrand factor type A [Firmicutes bacterium HGW-Firmicutes-7]|nr:MAG: von willebrand factor type A [Firmicutes bacterium HGW-Firmicutes-7]